MRQRGRRTVSLRALLGMVAVAGVVAGGCGEDDIVFPGEGSTPGATSTPTSATATPAAVATSTPAATATPEF